MLVLGDPFLQVESLQASEFHDDRLSICVSRTSARALARAPPIRDRRSPSARRKKRVPGLQRIISLRPCCAAPRTRDLPKQQKRLRADARHLQPAGLEGNARRLPLGLGQSQHRRANAATHLPHQLLPVLGMRRRLLARTRAPERLPHRVEAVANDPWPSRPRRQTRDRCIRASAGRSWSGTGTAATSRDTSFQPSSTMLSNHSSSDAVDDVQILSPTIRVSRVYISRGTLYLIATMFGSSAIRAHSSGSSDSRSPRGSTSRCRCRPAR